MKEICFVRRKGARHQVVGAVLYLQVLRSVAQAREGRINY